jgi:hypothetical protein
MKPGLTKITTLLAQTPALLQRARPFLLHSAQQCVKQCIGIAADGTVWLAAIIVLGLANFLLGFAHLPPRQTELMETIHLNAIYATMLVASAGTISRVLVAALERLGQNNAEA